MLRHPSLLNATQPGRAPRTWAGRGLGRAVALGWCRVPSIHRSRWAPLWYGKSDVRSIGGADVRFALVSMESPASRRSIREDRERHRKRIEGWMRDQAEAGTLVGGEAFETESVGPVTVRSDAAGRTTVTEGPFAPGEETLGGFVLVEVADRAEAIRAAESWPTGETIEVRPIWEG
ncbi:YciI family protein [Murinocardiopsis flavida]|uniref:YciI family protein n=1 Tax=Murinocardiopsis flavida TaxID=645275 RepID=UPI0037440911